jgi:hypothetical protein
VEVAEYEAEGEVARAYHEFRETLRVSGVDGMLRQLALHYRVLPALWQAVRPNLETRDFESAADLLRAEAARAAAELALPRSRVPLGDSQRERLRTTLELYHYIRPKILLLASALRLALQHHRVGRASPADRGPILLERGVPPGMAPMERVNERDADPPADICLRRIRTLFELPIAPDEYCSLALWPDYLAATWGQLTRTMVRDEYVRSACGLRRLARRLASSLPFGVPLPIERVRALGADAERVEALIRTWEGVLPVLTLNVAALSIDGQGSDAFTRSPFPAVPRGELQWT